MTEIKDIPRTIGSGDIGGGDFLAIHNQTQNAPGKATLDDVIAALQLIKTDGNAALAEVQINELTATVGQAGEFTVTTSLAINSTTMVSKLKHHVFNLPVATIQPGDTNTNILTGVTGFAPGDFLSISFDGPLPDGVFVNLWISGTDELTIQFFNAESVDTGAFTMDGKAIAIGLSSV